MSETASTIDILEAGNGTSGSGSEVAKAAKRIGCDLNYLQAILNVESGGDAFDAQGRLIILPEKHIFRRMLPKRLRGVALRRGLAARKWSRKNYKGLGRKGSDARWQRLRAMVEVHENAGLKSASYGKAQIMAFNHKICGYSDVKSFVLALAEHEDNHDTAFIAFLENSGLSQDLKERDTRAVTRRYNGPGQVSRYSAMIEREYKRLSGKSSRVRSTVRRNGLRLGSEGYKVKALQERLCALGYHTGTDGDFGPATRRQVVAFQADHGLKADGIVGPKTEAALENAVPIMQHADPRQETTVQELTKRSTTARKADQLKKLAVGAGGTGVVVETISQADKLTKSISWLETLSGYATQIGDFIAPVKNIIADHPVICLVIAAGIVWYFSDGILKRRMHDHKNWRHVG